MKKTDTKTEDAAPAVEKNRSKTKKEILAEELATPPRADELLFRGGDKTGAQLIQDTKETGCHGYLQDAKKIQKILKNTLGKKVVRKDLRCKNCDSTGTCKTHEPEKENCVALTIPAKKNSPPLRSAEAEIPMDTPMPPETCHICEAADICTRQDPRAGCMGDAYAEEEARQTVKKKPVKKAGKGGGA